MGENSGRESNTLKYRKNKREFTKIVTSKEQGTRKGEHNTKRYVLLKKKLITSHFLPKKVQARERRKKVQCKFVC